MCGTTIRGEGTAALAPRKTRPLSRPHDSVPDGKSGPWLREPHHRDQETGQLTYDERCLRCYFERQESMARHPAGSCWREEVARMVKLPHNEGV